MRNLNRQSSKAAQCTHDPVIVHRSGRISADKLNYCGSCGAWIVRRGDDWVEVDDETADKIRQDLKQ
jgi:hypothetical protein